MSSGNRSALHLINARLPLADETALYELKAAEGVWTSIAPQQGASAAQDAITLEELALREDDRQAARTVDVKGKIILPGFVDAHMHLDKAYTIGRVGNDSGTLLEAIRNYREAVPTFTRDEIKARMVKAALRALSFGTTGIRTHLDFPLDLGTEVAFRTIFAALEVRELLRPFIDIQLFPMCPYNRMTEGTVEGIRELLRLGVDGLGGAPHLSADPEQEIRLIFELAAKHDKPIDLHTDESDDPDMRTVGMIADHTIAHGYQGRVTVGHLCSLAAMDAAQADRLIRRMADAGLQAVTLPAANLYLQGRKDKGPVRRGVTRVKELLRQGIPLAAASDNIQDPFHPFGRGDLLQIGLITAYAAHMGSPRELRTLLRMITNNPARMTGIDGYGITEGHPATFVIVDARTVDEMFSLQPERRWVAIKGRWLRGAHPDAPWFDPGLRRLSESFDATPAF